MGRTAAGLWLGMVRGQRDGTEEKGEDSAQRHSPAPGLQTATSKRADGRQGRGLFSLSSPFSSPLPA